MFRIFTISIIILLSGCKKATKPDEAPIFVSATPTIETTTTKMGETHTVRGIAEDPDGDSFQYKTLKDGVKVNDTNEYTFTIDKKGITKIDVVAYNALSDTLTRNFSAENQAPVAQNKSISMLEEGTKTYNENELGSDPDGDTLEYRIISENNVDAKFENEKLKITGIENYFGNASVSYEVSDGDKKANGTITLNITNVDDPPTAPTSH